jgi:hypothetical protein
MEGLQVVPTQPGLEVDHKYGPTSFDAGYVRQTPQNIEVDERAALPNSKRICGLTNRLLGLIVIILLVIIGGAVGGSLAAKHNEAER